MKKIFDKYDKDGDGQLVYEEFKACGEVMAKSIGYTTKKLSDFVGEVEIAWRGQIERVCFPLRLDIEYLREDSKRRFYVQSDLSTQETRMQAAMAVVPNFSREMSQIGRLASISPL